ncbi:MAG: adenylosuccinate synthetase [Candidatus Nitrosocaldus sp.]|nr:adenylosuccinate synthetase [Candidatus Nitrosocaldus sp.]
MPATVVVGGFFGDEGKGKVIAYMALRDRPSIAVRGGVGPNAGHTFTIDGRAYKVRMLPSAVAYRGCRLMIGAGVLVDPGVLLKEVEEFDARARTVVDANAGVIEHRHKEMDRSEHARVIGTTGSGSGPANAERVSRMLKLVRDLRDEGLAGLAGDVSLLVNEALDRGEHVLVEGTQGTFLSLYHGTYPFVTSKDVTASAICSDVGIGPKRVDDVLLVFKAYVTRVGAGTLENELDREEARRRGWLEVATVTGRERRAAPFNMALAKRAVMLNSATQIAVTKIDVLFPECKHARAYEQLSTAARRFIESIEDELRVSVTLIGTGEDIYDMVDRRRGG